MSSMSALGDSLVILGRLQSPTIDSRSEYDDDIFIFFMRELIICAIEFRVLR